MNWIGLLSATLDYFFPPYCLVCGSPDVCVGGYLICPDCLAAIPFIRHPFCSGCGKPFETETERDHLCGECLSGESILHRVRSLVKFEGIIQDLIHQFKYRQRFAVGKICILLASGGGNASLDIDFYDYDCFIPVPLHVDRLRQRGFNQVVIWGELLHKRYEVPLERRALMRTIPTLPQVNMHGKARRENVRNVFKVRDSRFIKDKNILLLDDVYTTGATMRECARILNDAGASRVDGLSIARAV